MPRSNSSKKTVPLVYTSPKTPIGIPPIKIQQPTLLHTIKEGFGFGIGASIARNIVDRTFGSFSAPKTPLIKSTEYTQCIQEGGDEEVCKQYQ
jgi:hypothetical protein